MKTMGITDLRLVAPERFPDKESQWMATHAVDVLQAAKTYEVLGEAIADCAAAFALSARPREWSPQVLEVRAAAARATQFSENIAFVFGSEDAGLTNEEMFACQYLVHIPANPAFSSLNLAQAVQVVCYELFIAHGGRAPPPREEKLATVEDLEGMYAHIEEAARVSGFLTPQSRLRDRVRRLFSRVDRLEREEVNIVRGLLKALLKK